MLNQKQHIPLKKFMKENYLQEKKQIEEQTKQSK